MLPKLLLFSMFTLSACSPQGLSGVKTFSAGKAGDHRTGLIAYANLGDPPAGGPHNAVWQNCGVYSKPLAPEYVAHSLEHGAVWVSYRRDLPASELEKLKKRLENRSKVLLSPYSQQAAVLSTAWGVQKEYPGDSEDLSAFINRYQDRGAPEAGAPCTGGTDATDDRAS